MFSQSYSQESPLDSQHIFSPSSVNNLQQRMRDVIQLLQKNNSKFPQYLPSESQLKEILQHCFNCYDQLDFITLEYSKHPVNYLQPKSMAENSHKIMRISKYLVKNISHWVDSYSLELMKRIAEGQYFSPLVEPPTVRCSLCKNHVQQIAIRQVRNSLLGDFNLKEMFDEQLKEEKQMQRLKQNKNPKEGNQYIGSVNYLTRIIKEMEESAKGYDKLVQKIEKDEEVNDDMALLFLEELVYKMKIKLGEKSKARLRKIMKGLESKDSLKEAENIRRTHTLEIQQVISLLILSELPKINKMKHPTPQDILLKRLKDQNFKLKAQRNNLYASEHLNLIIKKEKESKENNQNQYYDKDQQNLFNRESEELNQESSVQSIKKRRTKVQLSRLSHSSQQENGGKLEPAVIAKAKVATQGRLLPNKKKSEKQLKRLSIFNAQTLMRGYKPSQLSVTFDKTINQGSDQNLPSLGCVEEETNESQKRIDCGCQWEDPSGGSKKSGKSKKSAKEQISTKKQIDETDPNNGRRTANRTNKDIGNGKNSTQMTAANAQKGRKSLTKKQQFYNASTSKGGSDPLKFLIKQGKSHLIMKRNSKNQNQTRTMQDEKDYNYNSQTCRNKNETMEDQQNKIKQQQNITNTIKSGRMGMDNLETKEKEEQLKQQQRKQNLGFNKSSKAFKMLRYATEFEESIDKRREKKVKNVLFKPEHLSFFGGVSESYSYEKSKLQQTEEYLSIQQKNQFLNLLKYVTNLKNFKNTFFQNVIVFLSKPFQTIEKNQINFKLFDDKKIYNCILKLIIYHKKKCGKAICDHMLNLGLLIGFVQTQ